MPVNPAETDRTLTLEAAEFRGGRIAMSPSTWITMLLVMAFVWGGFAVALVTAVRKESGKGDDD